MAKSIEELRAERRALEDLANMSLYERFTSGLGNMFDTTDPLAPKFGDVVGGMPSMPNTRTDMTMTGATTDALGNIVPSANTKVSGVFLGGPMPDYARPKPMQGITLNPGFTPGGSDPIYGTVMNLIVQVVLTLCFLFSDLKFLYHRGKKEHVC